MAHSPEPVASRSARGRVVRVIVIEPPDAQPRLRDLIETGSGDGFRVVHEFPRVESAAAALERDAADIVVADIGEDTVAVLEALAKQPALSGYVPFIVVDRASREESATRAMQIGAQDYLVRSKLTPPRLARSMRWSLERAHVERELKKESDLLHALLDYVPDKIYFKDRHGRFLRASTSVARWVSAPSAADLIGTTDFNYLTPEHAEATFADEQRVIETGRPIIGAVNKRTLPNGRSEWSSTTKLPLRDRHGRIVGTFGVTRDLTALKELEIELAEERNRLREANAELSSALDRLRRAHEELHQVQLQLIEAEKLKSVGRLAAGVAHEVKNPLAVISMGVEFLQGRYPDDETTLSVLHELADAVNRADGVIKGLLDFSAPRQIDLQPQDLNAIIRAALRLVRGEMQRERHRVELDLGEIPSVLVDRGKACQVFLNLFTNALHAMPDGGTLSVRTRVEQITGVGANIASERSELFQAGDTVVVAEIADTGPGIPPELLGRIFEPFFTTKATGKGTGLGLSVVKSIMNLQRGTIAVRNGETAGAVVTLTFQTPKQP